MFEFELQLFVAFIVIGVKRDAVDRTDFLTLGGIEMANALGTFVRVNDVDLWPHRYRFVGALWLADVAIDAFIGDI